MYDWRNMSPKIREEILNHRRQRKLPWHSPPHFIDMYNTFMITATNFEHQSIIGRSIDRMHSFQIKLLETLSAHSSKIYAWCVIPNHYHIVIETRDLKYTVYGLGQLHGRLSRIWNIEDKTPGRKCWYHCMDRAIRSERHLYSAVNYVHHRLVFHQCS
jgi:putative transposase